jgi:hypothetical protein
MDVLTGHRRWVGGRALVRMTGLALAVVLLVSLLAPLAVPHLGGVTAEKTGAADGATPVLPGDNVSGSADEGGETVEVLAMAGAVALSGPRGVLIAGPLAGLAGAAAWRTRRVWALKRGPSGATGATDAELVQLATSRFDVDRARWDARYWLGR